MATLVQQINPLDTAPSKGVGVNLPFSGKAVFNTTFQTQDATKANLVLYFLTNKGERVFNPNFGSDIRTLLFNNIDNDTVVSLKKQITNDIKALFPRVEIKAFEITAQPDRNLVRTYLRYALKNTNIEDEVLFNIEQ